MQQQPGHLWSFGSLCVTRRIPASTDSYSFGQHAAGSHAACYKRRPGSLPGNHCKKPPKPPAHAHTRTHSSFFSFRTVMGTHVNALPPPLHEYSFATAMSCDMLPWQGRGTTWPGCRREGKAVSERVTQACRVQLDFSISDGFQTFPSSCSASSFTL